MRIIVKILSAFFTVAVIGGLIGYVGFSGVHDVSSSFDVITHETTPELIVLGEIATLSHELLLEAASYALLAQTSVKGEDLEHELEEFEETKMEFDKAILKLEKFAHEEEFVEHITELKARLYVVSLAFIEKAAGADQQTISTLQEDLEQIDHEIHEAIEIRIEEEKEELEIRHTTAEKLATDTANFITIASVSGMILAIIFGVIISVTINRPITKLKEGSIQLGKGEFSELEVSGNDELTDLTKSFNNMSSNLLQSNIIITENLDSIKRQKKKLDTVYKELQESELLKEEFSSMVTHELRTPLTPIRGYCEILKDASFGTLTKDQLDYVEKINFSAVLLERLIGDVLDVQKLDMERMSFNKESFDVDDFLDRLKQDCANLMKDKGIEFVVTDSVKTTLKTDQLRLRQILENLIRNSVDFVPPKNGKIEVSAKQENGKIIFHVKDNGVGIPKEKQKNIFKKFYQVDTSHTRKHGGTGLGLVICKGIVNALGGEIWFESEPGKGTTFSFDIPLENN